MFQFISSFIAFIALTKALTALFMPAQFYGWRSRQYGSEAIPRTVLVLPLLFVALAGAAWYATLFAYRPYGWIVTAFTSLIAVMGLLNLSRWSTHRQKTAATINAGAAARTQADVVILIVGLLFAALALFLY